ncbi:MAG: hypothetical protein ACOCWX_04610 [Spirochaetota bacterium]
MKTKTILLGVVLTAAVVVLTGCGWLTAMDDTERANAFIETANASPRDYEEMQSHWSSTAKNYENMVTSTFWDETMFRESEQPFAVSGLTAGTELAEFPGVTTLEGTVTSDIVSGARITFGFVPGETNPLDRVIRVIVIEDPVNDTIQSVR